MRETAGDLLDAGAGAGGAWYVLLVAAALAFAHHARGWASALWVGRGGDKQPATAPSSGTTSGRIEKAPDAAGAAGADADNRAAVCGTCGFENFARAKRCVVCGACSPGAERAAGVLTADVARVRKRKEWTREVDARGRRFWRRHRVAGCEDRSDGYVLQFDAALALQPLREPEPVTSDAKEITSPRTQSANAAFSAALGFQMDGVRLELLDAARADPMRLPHDAFGASGRLAGFSLAASEDRAALFARCASLAAADFPSKHAYFAREAARLRASRRAAAAAVAAAAVASPPARGVDINSDFWLEQSLELINCADERAIRSAQLPVDPSLAGGPGCQDPRRSAHPAVGATREWLSRLSGLLADPRVGLFRRANSADGGLFINPMVESELGAEHLLYYHAAGRLIGHMLLNGEPLDFHLSVPLRKMILGSPVSLSDLAYLDEEKYRNLLWLLDHDGAQELELDFTVNERAPGGEVATIELIPAGRNIQVNDDNKYEYMDRVFRHVLVDSVSTQLCVLLKGLYEAVPQELLVLFDYQELDVLLCGADDLDVDDWQRHTQCDHGGGEPGCAAAAAWFWDALRAMPLDRRRRLLRFATGSARVPLEGFGALTGYDGRPCPFTLKLAAGGAAVRSHACFNTLELPAVASRQELDAALAAVVDVDVDE